MKNSLKHKLKFDYENLHETPSPELWERLENKLEGKKQTPKITFGFWKYAAALLLFISLSIIIFNNYEEKQDIVEAQKIAVSTRSKTSISTKNEIINLQKALEKRINIQKQIDKISLQKNSSKEILNSNIRSKNIKNNEIISVAKNESYILEKANIINDNIPTKIVHTNELIVQSVEIVSRKEPISYIKADELLFSREFSLTQKLQKKDAEYVAIDLSKIKKKYPSNIKILGITIYSDSLSTN